MCEIIFNPRAQLSPSGSPTTSTSATVNRTATSAPQAGPTNSLSGDAKAGIAIAVIVLVFILALAFLQRKRSIKKIRALEENNRNSQWNKTELPAEDVGSEARGYGPHMAGSPARVEVENTGVRREAPEDDQVLEAPGDLARLPELGEMEPGSERRGEMGR